MSKKAATVDQKPQFFDPTKEIGPEAASAEAAMPADPPIAHRVEVPMGALQNGYLSAHVEARLTTEKQRRNMRRMLQGLRQAGAKLENGRFVDTAADAVRWMLEQLA
jgi:hypothetical protein